jgi:hypothetical protein
MIAYGWRALVGGLVGFALWSPSQASAGFVLVTWGESISHIGHASPQAKQTHGSSQVGYKYGYWGVFWLDLWTHGGTYCVYDGDRYSPIQPAEAARLLGKREDELSTPFLYRVPLGWLIFGPLLVIWIVGSALGEGGGNAIGPAFQDPRYQQALDVMKEQYAKQPAAGAPAQGAESQTTTDDGNRFRVAFEAGVQHLIEVGIPREEAERNLATMIQVLAQAQQQEATAPASSGPA